MVGSGASLGCGSAYHSAQTPSGGSGQSSAQGTGTAELQPADIVKQSTSAIVRVEVSSSQGGGVGTGFVLTEDGRIATNLHVIGGAEEVEVVLLDGTRLPVSKVTAYDPIRDLAVLSVRSDRTLPTLALGNSDNISAGDPVVAIGNPLGVLDYTVSDGLISSVRAISAELTILQISAPISQGSSGGPLFNRYGEVIGVATAVSSRGQNINFGIPSNYLRPLLERDEALSLAGLNERMESLRPSGPASSSASGGGGGTSIQRQVPDHDVALLDGCTEESMATTVERIQEAINLGAPLYNQGHHEACFRIYEGAATGLERELACPGIRDALGQGLLRAGTLDDFTAKAWAMRDAFDGVLDVIARKLRRN